MMAGILVVTAVVSVYLGRNRPRKKRFAEFYRNYDPEAAAERMRQAGVFQSMGPDPPPDPDPKHK